MRKSFFGSSKGGAGETTSGLPPAKAPPAEQPLQKPIRPDTAARDSSVIGPNLVFKGELIAEEDLLIDGRIEGSIKHNGANLTVGARADVKADIAGRRIVVRGKVQGDMRASEAVIVEASAQVRGNIFAPRVALKEGAKFSGRIDMGSAAHIKNADGAAELGEARVNDLLKRAHT